MPDDLKPWILFFIFVVLPFIQWVLRKVAERHAAAEAARRGAGAGAGAPPSRPVEARRHEDEDEIPPDWIDPAEWEEIEELEEIEEPAEVASDRAPPPRRELDGLPTRPGAGAEGPPARPRELVHRGGGAPTSAPVPAEEPRRAPLILSVPPLPAAARVAATHAVLPASVQRGRPAILPSLPSSPRASGSAAGAPRVHPRAADLRSAVIWSEILGEPRALRPHGSEDRAGSP
jgi:hypothetical protein